MILGKRKRVVACACAVVSMVGTGRTGWGFFNFKNFIGDTLSTPSYFWNVSGNWSPAGLPASGDIVSFSPPSFHVFYFLDKAYTPATGPGQVTLDFSAYTLQANMYAGTWNVGTTTGRSTAFYHSASILGSYSSGSLNVEVFKNALYSLYGSGALGDSSSYLKVDSLGTFAQSGGTLVVGSLFYDSYYGYTIPGTVSGNMSVSAGSVSGDFAVYSGGTFSFTGGSYSGTLYTRAGSLASISTSTFAGAITYADGNLSVPSNFTVAGGMTVSGTFTNAASRSLTVNGPGLSVTDDITLGSVASPGVMTNLGTVNTTTLSLGDGLYTNTSGATTTVSGALTVSGTFTLSNSGRLNVGTNLTVNSGTVNQIAGTTSVTGSLVNSGILSVQGGRLIVNGPLSNDFSASFSGGTTAVTGNFSIGSQLKGDTVLSSGLLSIGGSEFVDTVAGVAGPGSTFTQSGGTNSINGTLSLGFNRGSYSLSGGPINAFNLFISTGNTTGSGGTFTQTGGLVSLTGSLQMAFALGTTASYTGQNSTLIAPSILAGSGGQAILGFTNQSVTVSGSILLGSASSGQATVTASSSVITASALTVGLTGIGNMTQSQGTTSVSGAVTIGSAATGNGRYQIVIAGGLLTAASETIGDAGIGSFVQAAGTHSVTGALVMANQGGSSGSYTLSGGRLSVGSLKLASTATGVASANFTQTGGTTAATGTVDVANDTFGSATVNINAGLFSAPTLNINRLGVVNVVGTLSVSTVTSTGSIVLAAANTIPVLNLQNLSTTSISSTLTVSNALNLNGGALAGSGTLNLPVGATLKGFGVINVGAVTNAGTLSAKSGNLLVPASTTFVNTGTLSNLVGSNLFIQSTNLTHTGSLTINGAGSVVFDAPITNAPGKTVSLLGGVLGTPTLTNSGTVSGFGQITADFTNAASGNVYLSGPSQIVGNLDNRGNFNASNIQTLVTGAGVNYGTIKTTKATIIFQGGLTNFGVYNSDPSDNYFTSLTVPGSGALIGSTGDNFIISGDFASSSVNTGWNTSNASLKFEGANLTTHELDYMSHTATPFAWGTITVDPGNYVQVLGTTPSAANSAKPLVATNLVISSSPQLGTATLQVASGLTVVTNLSIGTGSGLDLMNNDMIVHNGDAAALGQLVRTWFDNGARDIPAGIYSSVAGTTSLDPNDAYRTLAVFANVATGTIPYFTSFDAQSLVSTDVLVKYAYIGDLNLDGSVDGKDFKLAMEGAIFHLTGWQHGDINYDGVVDASDLSLLTQVENLHLPRMNGFPTEHTAGTAAIPEPGVSVVLLAAPLLSRRRRR